MPLTEETVNHFLETGETLVFNNSNGNVAGVGTIEDLGRVLNTRTSTPTSTANVTTTANLGARPKVMTSAPAATTASLRSHPTQTTTIPDLTRPPPQTRTVFSAANAIPASGIYRPRGLNPQAEAFVPGNQPPVQARSNPNLTGDGLNQNREDRLAAEAKRKAEEEALARIEAERYAAGFQTMARGSGQGLQPGRTRHG
jgi:hypothetical protein